MQLNKNTQVFLSDGKCESFSPTQIDSINCEVNHKICKVRENFPGTNVTKMNTHREGRRNVSQMTQKLNLKVYCILISTGEHFRKVSRLYMTLFKGTVLAKNVILIFLVVLRLVLQRFLKKTSLNTSPKSRGHWSNLLDTETIWVDKIL